MNGREVALIGAVGCVLLACLFGYLGSLPELTHAIGVVSRCGIYAVATIDSAWRRRDLERDARIAGRTRGAGRRAPESCANGHSGAVPVAVASSDTVNWRERQALPSPRPRWFFASVVPKIEVDEQTQKVKLTWPPKGAGHTYLRYPECRRGKGKIDRRVARMNEWERLRRVNDPIAA